MATGRGESSVGPGTGAVTRRIIRRMHPTDRLELVEVDEGFIAHLNGRFQNEDDFRAVRDRATVHCTRIENLPADDGYDIIISGLPLNNFAVADVEQILEVLLRLAGRGSRRSRSSNTSASGGLRRPLAGGVEKRHGFAASARSSAACSIRTKSAAIGSGRTSRPPGCIIYSFSPLN